LVVTKVRSESFGLVTERRHYNARPIYQAFMLRKFYFSSSVVSRAFSALCARYALIRRSSIIMTLSPRLPLCQIRFRHALHYWASPWRKKSRTQSLSHSLTQLIWFPGIQFQSNKVRYKVSVCENFQRRRCFSI